MSVENEIINVRTSGKGFFDITRQVVNWVGKSGIKEGLLTVFIQHTSASLTIQENADPDVMYDLGVFFERSIPEDNTLYRHTLEGRDDMPAHIRTSLTDVSLSIPVMGGRPTLGTWQGIYVCEHRTLGNNRRVALNLVGD
jgi:secondary thiamine-phosphate synthase enzyme